MKSILILSGILLLFTASAFGELTQADIEKIRLIVEESEKRTKEYVKIRIDELDARLSGKIEAGDALLGEEIKGLDKRLDQIFALVMVLIAFIAVVVGVPQILVAMQRKNERIQDEKIEAQQKQIEAQQKQIEAQQKQIEALRHEIAVPEHERIVPH